MIDIRNFVLMDMPKIGKSVNYPKYYKNDKIKLQISKKIRYIV